MKALGTSSTTRGVGRGSEEGRRGAGLSTGSWKNKSNCGAPRRARARGIHEASKGSSGLRARQAQRTMAAGGTGRGASGP